MLCVIETNSNEKAFIVFTVQEVVCIYCNCVTYCIFIMPGVWGEELLCHVYWQCGLCVCLLDQSRGIGGN